MRSLAAGKNNRLILSGTQELHDRISQLCSRIRELEEALASVQSRVSDEPHPLLKSELLMIKVPLNLTVPHNNANSGVSSSELHPSHVLNGNANSHPNHNRSDGVRVGNGVPEVPGASASLSVPAITPTTTPSSSSSHAVSSGSSVGVNGPANNSSTKDENFIDAFGTLSIGCNGETSFLGKTARSEYLIRVCFVTFGSFEHANAFVHQLLHLVFLPCLVTTSLLQPQLYPHQRQHQALSKPSHASSSSYDCPRLPKKIIDSRCPNEVSSLSSAASSSSNNSTTTNGGGVNGTGYSYSSGVNRHGGGHGGGRGMDMGMGARIGGQEEDPDDPDSLGAEIWGLLPELSEALRLCDVYLEAGRYMYAALPRNELLDDILAPVYRVDSFSSLSNVHTLGLLFIIFALGALFDQDQQPYSLEAKEYFLLARAAKNYATGVEMRGKKSGVGTSGHGVNGVGGGSVYGNGNGDDEDQEWDEAGGEYEDEVDIDVDVDVDESEREGEGGWESDGSSPHSRRAQHRHRSVNGREGALRRGGGGNGGGGVLRTTGEGGGGDSWGMSVIGLWTMIHMSQYLEFSDWEALGSQTAWWWVGFSVRLAVGLGLHLNSARWEICEEMQKKRALVFWQIFTVDTWLSFNYGRPPSLSRTYIDCPLPEDTDEYVGGNGKEIGCEYPLLSSSAFVWFGFSALTHHRFFLFLSPLFFPSTLYLRPTSPHLDLPIHLLHAHHHRKRFWPHISPYSLIIDFDRQVRDFPVPQHLRPRCHLDPTEMLMATGGREHVKNIQGLSMQRWMTMSYKEATLLNLHRAYFAQALQDSPDDLASHKYLPSVMATYRSAWRLIQGLKMMWRHIPRLLERYNLAWSQALSAAIVMCILVTRSPHSKMTKSSLAELDTVVELFEDASSTCRSAANILDTLKNLRHKAHEAVDQKQYLSDLASSKLSVDELDRLGGRTHLIAAMSASHSSTSKSTRRRSKAGSHTSSSNSNSTSPISNHESPTSASSPNAGSQPHQVGSSMPFPPPLLETTNLVPAPSHSQPQSQPQFQPQSQTQTQPQSQCQTFQDLFPTETMHPSIARDMQMMDIINDPSLTLSTGPGPWPPFYDLPTGLPGLASMAPPSLPQYASSSVPLLSRNGGNGGRSAGGIHTMSTSPIYSEPSGGRGLFHSEESSPDEPMSDIQFPDPQSQSHSAGRRYSIATTATAVTDISSSNGGGGSGSGMDWSSMNMGMGGMGMMGMNVNVPPEGWPSSVPFVDVPFYDHPSRSPMGFPTGSYSGINPISGAPILDATWQSFVEQLGF
ncbi:hypothetical protein D9758_016027 [Tetrapyrgos nigripes]|uniref:Xylanolytic transcriptional activator regulatory domain-containing protein n=1 Tax=Tetrapyrgos nigripes TaxID=182062 RepID=A0A8H5FI75_9AGAR|nr:hypothetical protein D9758_016027 [Tetrapyrgos nigripes]